MDSLDERQVIDIWTVFKEYLDKKYVETAAERYVELLADFGVIDETFRESLGSDTDLDNAIGYYLDIDSEFNDEDEWDN